MSAIFGIAGGGDVNPDELRAVADRLAHRGRTACYWSPGPGVRFGVRHEAEQSGGEVADLLAMDGTIDNVARIEQLIGSSDGGTSRISAEHVQRLVCRLGREGLSHLDGPFAIAYWERGTGTLLLARDRTGFRPLFYTSAGGRLAFASEYKALLALAEVAPRPNREALQRIQRTKYTARDETCLEGIFPVPPGEWVAFQKGEIQRRRYWGIPSGRAAVRSEREHIALVEKTFLDVTALQTEPHDPIGVALSGDLDSTAMLAAMRVAAPAKEIHTFTAGHGPEDQQLIRARTVAAHFGVHHHEIVLRPNQLPGLLPQMVWHMGDPIGREEFACLFLLGREAGRYVSNIFLGTGCDGIFSGMPRHLLVNLAFKHPLARRPLADFYNYTQTGRSGETRIGRLLVAGYFHGSQSEPPAVLGAADNSPRASLERSTDQPLTDYLRSLLLATRGHGELEQLFAASCLGFHGPFAGSPLIDLAQGIPDHLKIHGLKQKYVFRRACERIVPKHLRPKKKGFQKLPHDRVFSDQLDTLADELLSPSAVARRGLFALSEVERFRRRAGTRPYPTERLYRLWTLILIELWGRTYLDDRGRGPAEAAGSDRE